MRILDSRQAAAALGISQRRVEQLAERIGNLATGRYYAFSEEAVERFRLLPRKSGRPTKSTSKELRHD